MASEKCSPAFSSLSWLCGVWESVEAEVFYPTMETTKYREVMEYLPATEPMEHLAYKSETWHLEKKSKLHCERGFIRIDPKTGKVALLSAHMFGMNEIAEGTVENQSLHLESQSLTKLSFYDCAEVVKVVRRLERKGDELHYALEMATGGHPLQPHAQTRYRKIA